MLRSARPGIASALPADDEGAAYDRRAAAYDRVIGNRLYNRLIWGTDASAYAAFAAEALAAGDGPMLDAGCGSAVFTADVFARTQRPVVLTDRSLDMLERAGQRLDGDAPTALLQADLFDLPFAPARFQTVGCFAMLHVLDDPWTALTAAHDQLAPGGRLFASMLVRDGGIVGRGYLRVLERAGEVGSPRSTGELTAAARELFGGSADVRRTGSMAWLRATRAAS